jgi:hypothetical protein
MKKRYFIILLVLIAVILFLNVNRDSIFRLDNSVPGEEPDLLLEKKDSNLDGEIDNWLYRDGTGTPVKWIRDSNSDGRPDHWSFFRDGKSFLDNVDTDYDGKTDAIYLTIWDSQGIKQRSYSLSVRNKETNVFVLHEDTGWISDDKDLTGK